jgi:uncharacterized repeat protein (TIGR03833 family)
MPQEGSRSGQMRNHIKTGDLVDIVLKADQRTGKLTRGHVKRILTKSPTHPHGIKVMLEEGGLVGRVQKFWKNRSDRDELPLDLLSQMQHLPKAKKWLMRTASSMRSAISKKTNRRGRNCGNGLQEAGFP